MSHPAPSTAILSSNRRFDVIFEKSGCIPLFFDPICPSVNILHTPINIVQDKPASKAVRFIN